MDSCLLTYYSIHLLNTIFPFIIYRCLEIRLPLSGPSLPHGSRSGLRLTQGDRHDLQMSMGKGQDLKMLFPGGIFDAEITAEVGVCITVSIFSHERAWHDAN
jgi:hypothetical protein